MSTGTLFDIIGQEEEINSNQIDESLTLSEERIEKPKPKISKKDGEMEFMQMASEYKRPEEEGFLSDLANYGKAAGKALIKGVHKAGRMMGPLIVPGKSEQQVQEEFSKGVEELIPTREGGFVTKATERALEEGPSMMIFPGGGTVNMAARVGGAAVLEQIGEEFGLGETGQNILGLTAYLGPEMAAKLLESGKSGELVKAGRAIGMTDKQIAPLLNSEVKQAWLSKLTSKRGRAQKVLENTRAGLNAAYEGIKKGPAAAVSEAEGANLIKSVQDKLFEMPSVVRETIATDLKDFASKPITKESIINFWQDINANLSSKTRQLANLKEPLKDALAKIDPVAANQFEAANKLYGKYRDISARLKPGLVSDLMGGAQALKLMGGLAFGYYPVLVEALGEQGAKVLSREMMINPRFQQLSQKLVSALNQNKIQAVKKITDSMIKETKDTSPKAAQIMQSIDWDEWESNR